MLEVKKCITEEEMIMLDEQERFIPLTYDKLFKGIFKENLELLKLFILDQLEFDVDPDDCKVELFDSEIFKYNKSEYQKTVDLYVKIQNIYVNVEINRKYFKNVEKRNLMYADRLYSMILEQGNSLDDLEDKIFVQINLNAVDKLDVRREKLKYGTDKLVTYGLYTNEIYNDNKFVLVKYLEYYRDLYYNKMEKLGKADLWMVLLASRTFQELYNVSLKLFDEEMHMEFMRKVICMIGDRRFFEDWELEKLNRYVEYKEKQNVRKDGLEEGLRQGMEQGFEQGMEEGFQQGIEQGVEKGFEQGLEQGKKLGIEQTVRNMLEEGMDISLISRVTGKTEEEIGRIRNTVK